MGRRASGQRCPRSAPSTRSRSRPVVVTASKIDRFLQVANPGLILFATGPPGPSRTGVGKIQLGYPERLCCSTSDFEPLTSVIDLEHEFVIRASPRIRPR